MKIIDIKNNQGIPKYKQIIASIEKRIEIGQLKKDQKLPSINKVCIEFSLSRDTVLLAYDVLKKKRDYLCYSWQRILYKKYRNHCKTKNFFTF